MSGVRITITGGVAEKLKKAAFDALIELGDHALEESNRVIPEEEEILKGSGHVSKDPKTMTVRVGYDTPYAVVQHEDLSFQHDPGRKAKFLEDAFLGEVAPRSEEHIASKMRGVS